MEEIGGDMKKNDFFWVPRILAILFILFVSSFALDVFELPQWYWALFIHLIPSYILIALIVIAWKKEKWGGGLFILTGLLSLGLLQSTIIAIPCFIIGVLFLIAAKVKDD